MCVCVTFVAFTDCESYTRPMSSNPVSGSGRVWSNACDVFRRAPSRGGHGRRAAVDFVVRFGLGGLFSLRMRLFFVFRAKKPVYNDNEAVFCLQAKKPLHTGVRTGCQ